MSNDPPNLIEIRGEVFINKDDFQKINLSLQEKDKFTKSKKWHFSSLRQPDTSISHNRPLKFIAHGIGDCTKFYDTIQDYYIDLKNWKIPINKHYKFCYSIDEIINHYNKVNDIRSEIEFDIDGLVIKIDNINLQKRLGYVGKNPRWAVALKFSAEKAQTVIEAIDYQVGRTGAITPVARLKL